MAPESDLAAFESYFYRKISDIDTDLRALEALVKRWQDVQNLVSRETLVKIRHRHILDSLQILPLLPASEDAKGLNFCDIGSGGGFPALPLAIALKGSSAHFHLVESNGRKCAFLNAVGRELGLAIHVYCIRIEALTSTTLGDIDVFTSRALAPLPLLFKYLAPLWGKNSVAILHKGREYGEERNQADSVWSYSMLEHKSATDPSGVLLEITSLTQRSN